MRTKHKVPHYETVSTMLHSNNCDVPRYDDDETSKTYKIPPIPAVSYVLMFTFWRMRREDKTF